MTGGPARAPAFPALRPRPRADRALVLACDGAFAVGAETLLYSVLRHNPWFDARVIVITDGSPAHLEARLGELYPVELVQLDDALRAAAARVVRSGRVSSTVARRLHGLQVFGLPGLDRAVYLDADMLCLGDVRALFECENDFAAAPDAVQLERELRPPPPGAYEPYGRALAYSFNTGMLSISSRWLTRDVYRDLLQLAGLAEGEGTPQLADQYVLNHFFDGRASAFDPRYNFIVSAEPLIRRRYALSMTDVRILHFAACTKPWDMSWSDARRRMPARFTRHYDAWYELRHELTGELTDAGALDEYRAGLAELSRAARDKG